MKKQCTKATVFTYHRMAFLLQLSHTLTKLISEKVILLFTWLSLSNIFHMNITDKQVVVCTLWLIFICWYFLKTQDFELIIYWWMQRIILGSGTEIQRLTLRKNFMGQTSVPLDFLHTDATFTIHITRSKIIIKILLYVAERHACHYHKFDVEVSAIIFLQFLFIF